MSNKLVKNNTKNNVNDSNNKEMQQEIRVIMYKEEDINALVQLLMASKPEFENIELFFMLKKILMNPIKYDKPTE